jgi:formylglycine-generating enzyme required for sulfatase activity
MVFRDERRLETERYIAANVLADFLSHQPINLANLLIESTEFQFEPLFHAVESQSDESSLSVTSRLKQKTDEPPPMAGKEPTHDDYKAWDKFYNQQANAAVALIRLQQTKSVWSVLEHRPDPTLRSYLIHRLGILGCDARLIAATLSIENDESGSLTTGPNPQTEVSIRRALILSLEASKNGRLLFAERSSWKERLLTLYREDPDPGVHGAVEWLLRQWGQSDQLQRIDKEELQELSVPNSEISKDYPSASKNERRWYVDCEGHTMIINVVNGPVWLKMGRFHASDRDLIKHSFAIAAKEVTVEQFQRYWKECHGVELNYTEFFAHARSCPMNSISWYDAAGYCNWLSKKRGLSENQWCYAPNEKGRYAEGMKYTPDVESKSGYRLPTEAEWVYSCRAGSTTQYSFGNSVALLGKYAWYNENSGGSTKSVGSLKPNDLGIFDLQGNVWEWCQWPIKSVGLEIGAIVLLNSTLQQIRGGSVLNDWHSFGTAETSNGVKPSDTGLTGFRVARNFP